MLLFLVKLMQVNFQEWLKMTVIAWDGKTLAARVDAKKSTEIACEYDLYCGGGVDVVEA